jgi:NtrC-family two-component system response regulator AlgB
VEAMKNGAVDYIAKPFTPDQVRLITRRIGKICELETQIAALKEDVSRSGPEDRLQSRSHAMQQVIDTAKKAAASKANRSAAGGKRDRKIGVCQGDS